MVVIFASIGVGQDSTSIMRDSTYVLPFVTINAMEAHRRETPVTFSNLGRGQIRTQYSVQDIPILLSELPSMTAYSENGNGIGYNYVTLRGFDQRRISVMINGVPQNDPEDHNVYWIDFPDLLSSVDGIQVQRGAGSAFYGPPAIGGSINLVTNPFGRTPGITFEANVGLQEFHHDGTTLAINTRKYSASVNSGLVDQRYLMYGRLSRLLSEGYRERSQVEMDSYFLGAVRIDNNFMTRLHLYGGPISDGLVYNGLPAFVNSDPRLRRANLAYWETDSSNTTYAYAQPRRAQEIENFSQPHYELLNDWQVSPGTAIHSTLFYFTGDGFFDYDASWADSSLLRLGSAYNIPVSQNPTHALVRATVANSQWGWLPRIEMEHPGGTLTLGVELRFHRSLHWGKIQYAEGLPQDFDPDYRFYEYNGEKDIFSVFAHEVFRPTDDITFLADLQLVRNRYGIHNEKYLNNSFDLSYLFANPRLGMNVNVSERSNLYVSAAYTSREPRLRNLYAAEDSYFGATPQFRADTSGGNVRYDFSDPFASPEHLLDVELGYGFHADAGRVNVNLYWMEFTDELVKNGQVDIFGQPVTGNAERSRHVGLEIDWEISLAHSLSFSQNVSLSRNRLIGYTVIEGGSAISLDGNAIAGFPDIVANTRFTYKAELMTSSLLVKYVGPFYTDNFENNQNRNNAYVVANLESLWHLTNVGTLGISLRAEVRNVLNHLYTMNGEGNAFFPAAERNYLFGLTVQM